VSDVVTGSDPNTSVVTLTVVVVVSTVLTDDCLTVFVIFFDVVVIIPRLVATDVSVIVAVAKARLSARDGAEDGARLGDSDGLPLGASDGGSLGASHLKSTRSALAPSVFKKISAIVQLATGSAHDKSQHKIWLNDVAPLNMPSKLSEELISQIDRS
jgi:hypothetical protein